MQSHKKWFVCALAFLMILSSVLTIPVQGATEIRVEVTGDLTIDYQYDGQPISGAQFHVYRVADVSAGGVFTLTGAFEAYPVELNGLSDADMADAARTLYGYAQLDGITPDYSVVTDENGTVMISDLPTGLYLVVSDPVVTEEGTYTTEPQLVSLPTEIDDEWVYSLILKPKSDFEEPEDETVEKKVQKIWNDAWDPEKRPASVTIHLLRDGEIYDTVILSAENRWRYEWTDLPADHVWLVVEEVPEGYFVVVQHVNGWVVIINTLPPDEPSCPTVPTEPSEPTEPSIPTEPSQPTEPSVPTEPTEPTQPSVPTEPSKPTEPTEPSTEPTTEPPTEPTEPEPELPDTGLLWWPVPLMLAMGLVLVILGTIFRRRETDEA